MHHEYKPRGVCSQNISFDIENGAVVNLKFTGGCNGNLQGIAKLVEGMTPEQVIDRLKDIRCGFRSTSCPDQLSKALTEALEKSDR